MNRAVLHRMFHPDSDGFQLLYGPSPPPPPSPQHLCRTPLCRTRTVSLPCTIASVLERWPRRCPPTGATFFRTPTSALLCLTAQVPLLPTGPLAPDPANQVPAILRSGAGSPLWDLALAAGVLGLSHPDRFGVLDPKFLLPVGRRLPWLWKPRFSSSCRGFGSPGFLFFELTK